MRTLAGGELRQESTQYLTYAIAHLQKIRDGGLVDIDSYWAVTRLSRAMGSCLLMCVSEERFRQLLALMKENHATDIR